MINEFHFPKSITGRELDDYLSKGWYRMWQFIFTTDFVEFNEFIYEVFWLRLVLQKVKYGKSQQKIIAKNKGYAIEIKPYKGSLEIEELYALYRTSINFDAPVSVEATLLNGAIDTVYDTHIIEVRDSNKLIAAGFFDLGETSVAGILNFYHPQYSSKSLGIYLLLLAVDHAKNIGKKWFYPGYIVNDYPKFDYKLFPDKNATEVYWRTLEVWIPF